MTGSASPRLWLLLARRFAAAPATRRPAGAVALIGLASVVLAMSLAAFDQSGTQLAQQELGRYDFRAELNGALDLPPGSNSGIDDLIAAATAAGAVDPSVVLQTFDVRPSVLHPPFSVYLEGPWASEPFPARYSLISGHWPTSPGDVAVTPAYRAAAPDLAGSGTLPQSTSVLSGNATLRVVGVFRDRYGTSSRRILAAPGTWQRLDGPLLSARYPALTVAPALFWSGAAPGPVEQAAERVIAGRQLPAGPAAASPPTLISKAQLVSAETGSYSESIPLAYTIPSLALPLLAALSAFGINSRRLRRNTGVLRAVGVRSRDAVTAVILASSWWLLIASVVGSALGVPAALLTRQVAREFSTRPLAPVSGLFAPLTRTFVVVLCTCAVVLLVSLTSSRRPSIQSVLRPLPRLGTHADPLRRALLTAVVLTALVQTARLSSVVETMFLVLTFAVAAALAVPTVLPIALQRLPAKGPRARLARQQLLTDNWRGQTAVVLLSALTGLAFAMVILLQALTASEGASRTALTTPGQVNLATGGGSPNSSPPDGLVALAQTVLGPDAHAIDVGYVGASDNTIANLTGQRFAPILAVSTAEEADQLSDGRLTLTDQNVLRNKGMVLWRGSAASNSIELLDLKTDKAVLTTAPLPVAHAAFPANWEDRAAGVVLRSTMTELSVPVSHSLTVFTNVSQDDTRRLQTTALAAGFDVSQVQAYSPPDPVVAPSAFWAGAVGLALLLLLAIASVARAQARSLRGYLGGLVAIGLSRTWTRQVLYLEITLLLSASLVLGVAVALPPILLAAVKIPGFVFAAPYLQLLGLAALLVLASGIATWQGSRDIRAATRAAT